MSTYWESVVWPQFGAALDMLGNAIEACPDLLWGDRTREPQFWYVAYHTLFWLDLYLDEAPEAFAPPPPFTLDELDPSGKLPERVYAKRELLDYLDHGRRKCHAALAAMTDERAGGRYRFGSLDLAVGELQLYNLRHVQHHAGQLHLLLRQVASAAPRWVRRAGEKR